MKTREVMTTEVVTGTLGDSYKHLVELMIEHQVSGVPIVDDQGRILGIVTEADLVDKQAYGERRKGILAALHQAMFGPALDVAKKAWATSASGLMTETVHTAHVDDDVRDVARRLLKHTIKRMPVVDQDGRVVGIVSRRDLLVAFARPDDEIKREVARVLMNPFTVPEDASVEDIHVRDGRVVLRGSVEYPSDIAVVTAAVRHVVGVIGVESQLHARSPEPELTEFSRPLA